MKKNYTILVIDDNIQIIKLISSILKTDTIDIISAENVQQAFIVLSYIDVHLIIVDYRLPDGTGLDIVKHIRENEKDKYIPIIMLSGENDNIKLPALKTGVNMFLSKPFDTKELKEISYNLLELLNAYESLEQAQTIILALTKAVELRDTYTSGHSQRVAEYSLLLYDAIGLNDFDDRESLEIGCLLHDIGKIGTPDSILKSNAKLTPLERKEVEKHPLIGYKICKDLKNLHDMLPIIKHHHEKLNGTGYPDGLKDKEIPIIVQIVTIADIYDALTSDRAYRTKNTPQEAFTIMEEMVKNGEISDYLLSMFKSIILK